MLHVSRPVRWDSDHVTIMNDDVVREIVLAMRTLRTRFSRESYVAIALNRVHIGLDYFDASINRIGAYVIGMRAATEVPVAGIARTAEHAA